MDLYNDWRDPVFVPGYHPVDIVNPRYERREDTSHLSNGILAARQDMKRHKRTVLLMQALALILSVTTLGWVISCIY